MKPKVKVVKASTCGNKGTGCAVRYILPYGVKKDIDACKVKKAA
jgi:hypothetical protein